MLLQEEKEEYVNLCSTDVPWHGYKFGLMDSGWGVG